MEVAVQKSPAGLYRPPEFNGTTRSDPLVTPPQTIISFPVHDATCPARYRGTSAPAAVALQVSVDGSYRPPVGRYLLPTRPPQTIISVPVHTAVLAVRGSGAFVTDIGVQLSVDGR